MTALVVVANMFFEFKLAETQFSFTLVVCALTGAIIGPLYGALACFLGDLVGFFYNSGGYAYYPWIGISMALVAVIAGLVYALPWRWNGALPVKTAIVTVATFLLCTVAINTTAFWLIYSKVSYTTYLVSRLFVQGQIWNSLVNYALLFALLPFLRGVKALRLKI
jgi:ECF transporter S component (folate family)